MVANWSNWIKKHSEACQHWKIVAKLPSLLPWGISGQSSRPVGSSSIATWNRWLDWLQNKVAQLNKTAMSRYSLEFWRNSTSLTKGIWGTSQEVRQAYCSWQGNCFASIFLCFGSFAMTWNVTVSSSSHIKLHQLTSNYHIIRSILIRFSSTSFNIFMLRVRATNLRYVTGEIFLPSPDIFCCDRTPHTTCQRVPKCSKPRQLPLVPVSKTQDSNALVLL